MKKILIFFLIFLLLLPMTIAKEEKELKEEDKDVFKSNNWGFTFTKLSTNYGELLFGDTWFGLIEICYKVIGIGRHDIHWEVEYEIYTYDDHVPQPQIGVFQENDSIYLFDLTQRPIIKPKVSVGYYWPFFQYDRGHWTVYLYVDGVLTNEEYFEWTHR